MNPELTQLITVAGGALLIAIAERRRLAQLARRWSARPTPPAGAATGAAGELPGDLRELVSARGLTPRCWSLLLNEQPDRAPHVLLVGPSGAGKTTFTRALLATRAGRVLVLTPKPDDDWGGAPVVTIDDDGRFAGLAQACDALGAEVRRRLVAGKRRAPVGEPLTIVCDDFPVIVSEVGPPAAALFKLVGRLGRSLRVRLVVLSQSERVKSLGLSGEGDAAENFTRVDLARGHRATLLLDGYALPLDTHAVPDLAAQPLAPARRWELSATAPAEPAPAPPAVTGDEEADLRPFRDALTGIPPVTGDDTGAHTGAHTGAVPPDGLDAETISALHSAGWSMNRIAAKMARGTKQQRLERIHRALAERPAP